MQQLEQMSRTLQRTLTDDDDGNDKQLEQPNEHWNTIGSTQRHNNWLNSTPQQLAQLNATTIGSTKRHNNWLNQTPQPLAQPNTTTTGSTQRHNNWLNSTPQQLAQLQSAVTTTQRNWRQTLSWKTKRHNNWLHNQQSGGNQPEWITDTETKGGHNGTTGEHKTTKQSRGAGWVPALRNTTTWLTQNARQ